MKKISFIPDTLVEELKIEVGENSSVSDVALLKIIPDRITLILNDEHPEMFADLRDKITEILPSCAATIITDEDDICMLIVAKKEDYYFEVDNSKVETIDDKDYITIRLLKETKDVVLIVE